MADDWHIEIASKEHENDINNVLKASFSSLLSSKYDDISLTTILPRLITVNPILLECGTYYIARNPNGDVVGCGGWTHERPGTKDKENGIAHVRHFATHPEYIGCGVGHALFQKCAAEAQKENVETFECYSTLNAEIFYKSIGFHSVNTFDLEMGDGLTMPAILMRANL